MKRWTWLCGVLIFALGACGSPDRDEAKDGPQTWSKIPVAPIAPRAGAYAFWTGREMLVLGGRIRSGQGDDSKEVVDGGAYEAATRKWHAIKALPLETIALAVWTGKRLLVWGSKNDGPPFTGDGFAYDPATRRWSLIARAPSWPSGAAVWAGDRAYVWFTYDVKDGGTIESTLASYDPTNDRWTPAAQPPFSHLGANAFVWTGSRLIVWGGSTLGFPSDSLNGASYDPTTNHWTPIAKSPLDHRLETRGLWIGNRILVWGELVGEKFFAECAAYDPATDRWSRLASAAPADLESNGGLWTGSRVITWDGADGATYDPETDVWSTIPNAPISPRDGSSLVWAGTRLLVWGGQRASTTPATPGAQPVEPPFEPFADGAAYTP